MDAETDARTLVSALESRPATAIEQAPVRILYLEALSRNGRGAEPHTRELAEGLVRAMEAASDVDAETLATSLRLLGDVLLDGGDYRAARVRFEQAIRTRDRVAAEHASQSDLAEDLDHLSRALIWLERYDEALTTSNRAVEIRERQQTDVALAASLEVRGLLRQRRGEYPRARSDLDRALSIRETSHAVHPDTVALLTLLGEQVPGWRGISSVRATS